jgi:hypothetical protein
MASGQFSGIKRFFLWDYPRAGWQYDVMVALILAFIFLTPREIFRDQPRASNVVRLPAEQGTNVFWVEPELLNGVAEAERSAAAATLIRSHFGRSGTLVRVEPIVDREQETKGYLVYTRP